MLSNTGWPRNNGWLHLALGVLGAIALSACHTAPVRESPAQTWETRRPQLQARDQFELRGRVAVATGSDGFNARLRWTQSGARTQMSLDGPLGAGGVQVTADGSDVSIVTSKGEHLDSDAARTELANRLGFDPPLTSLRYWILGVPDPGQPAQESLDAQQRLVSLQQAGWDIQYGDYMSVGGEWLPSRLTLQRAGVRLRVIVDGWNS
ncbi:MAG TPA: lipoprotein insertase outer membrane protein LolB [Steroidobacteraceae bacterium]|nr:lipoprotein insertase outer membrane protein LolB [Steroidobacteraceae bacterium]